MGTSVVPRYSGSSKFFIWVMDRFAVTMCADRLEAVISTVARAAPGSGSLCARCGYRLDPGILREPIESLITPQLSFHPIEGSLLCQTSAHRFRRFATMPGKVLEFLVNLLLRDFDIFGGRDAVHDQLRLDVIRGAFLLPPSQSYPVEVDRARVDALRRQRAHHPLQPHVHLMLDQGLGNGEVVKFHEGGEDFLVQQLFVLVIALMLEVFTNLLLQLIERRHIANVFGKF